MQLIVMVLLVIAPVHLSRAEGIVMLVGDVLPLKNQVVWRNLVKLAERKPGKNLIIAGAHSRPKLYGGFAQRAFQRYGSSADLLPIAEVFQEFSTDFRFATEDRNLTDQVRNSSSVFFVGGLPQRLSTIMYSQDGELSDLGRAIQEAHAAGSMIIGGISGPGILSTEADAIEILTDGAVDADYLHRGLGLIWKGWFADQHYFSRGRFASGLVAMHQSGLRFGIGVGLDTVAVLHSNVIEVLGNRGVIVSDISDATFSLAAKGVSVRQVRLSYLENGDRLDAGTMAILPYQKGLTGFEIVPQVIASEGSQVDHFVSSQEMFLPGELVRLMHESLEAETGQSQGYALHHGKRDGFRFRFYTGPDSRGWLATSEDGEDKLTLANIYLDIEPL